MPEITTERLRALLDEIDAETKDADSAAELETLKARLDKIEAALPTLGLSKEQRQLLDDALADAEREVDDAQEELEEEGGEQSERKPKMRRGRKRGMVYQDRPGEPGYVFQGDDEPDLVPVEEEQEEATG